MSTTIDATPGNVELGAGLQDDPSAMALVSSILPVLADLFGEDVSVTVERSGKPGDPQLQICVKDRSGAQAGRTLPMALLRYPSWTRQELGELKLGLAGVREWLAVLRAFYEKIRTWCQASAPELVITGGEFQVNEPLPGRYSAPTLTIVDDPRMVWVVPMGRWVVGTDGRVDLYGPEQSHTLIYSQGDRTWRWVEPKPTARLTPLSAELFLRLVRDCMG